MAVDCRESYVAADCLRRRRNSAHDASDADIDHENYGMLHHIAGAAIKATLLLDEKVVLADGAIVELVIWRLPRATPDRPHGLKYRLYFGRSGKCLVHYDNEAGKGDHRHVDGRQEPYRFMSVAKLRRDFEADIRRYGGCNAQED